MKSAGWVHTGVSRYMGDSIFFRLFTKIYKNMYFMLLLPKYIFTVER